MNFELTPQMIDKIAFAMEDQKERFAVDVETGELVPLSIPGSAVRTRGTCGFRAGAPRRAFT